MRNESNNNNNNNNNKENIKNNTTITTNYDKVEPKIDLQTYTLQQLNDYIKTNSEHINTEIENLASEMYFTKTPNVAFRELQIMVLDIVNKSYQRFVTRGLLKLLYIIYTNDNNRYKYINHIMFNNNKNQMLIATMNKKENTYTYPLNIEKITTNRSTYNNTINRLIYQFKGNRRMMDLQYTTEVNEDILLVNKEVSKIMIDYFKKLNNPILTTHEQESDDNEEGIENIHTIEQYINKDDENENELKQLNEIPDGLTWKQYHEQDEQQKYGQLIFVPDNIIRMKNLHTLINKYADHNFKFLLTPQAKRTKFESNNVPTNILTKTKIKIIQKETIETSHADIMVTKLRYTCPGCGQEVRIEPNDIGTKIVHHCDPINKQRTTVYTNILTPDTQKSMTLYKCDIQTNYDKTNTQNINTKQDSQKDSQKDNQQNLIDETWAKDMYLYTFDDDIEPGYYITDIVKLNEPMNILAKDKRIHNYIILGYKKSKIQYHTDKIIKSTKEMKDEIEETTNINNNNKKQYKYYLNNYIDINNTKTNYNKTNNKLPRHKIFNIIYSIRQYYLDRLEVDVNDDGLLLQVMTTLSTIARSMFKEPKLGISVMGVGSVSKTFPVNTILKMTDINYRYISDAARLSTAGLTGGINAAVNINGIMMRKFERGIISNNGAVTLDECQSIYLNQEIQSIIKSIPQSTYEVAVVGGGTVEFNATPILLANFNDFSKAYEKKIVDAYIVKYKNTYKYENERRLRTNQDIIKYLRKINMYQNIEYYYETLRDEILANIVYSVRKQYENDRIDWKTGSQLEAMNRLLFDVVVHRKQNISDVNANIMNEYIKETMTDKNIKEIKMETNMPIQQVVEELNEYIYGDRNIDENDKINLNDESRNTANVRTQLRSLNKSIHTYLTTERLGMNVTKYYIQNVDNFDRKIQNMVYKVIKILQLMEDVNASTLSLTTKQLANTILLKLKRGLSQEEYNMVVNTDEIKTYANLSEEYLLDLDDTRTELYYGEKLEKDLEKIEKGLTEKIKEQIQTEEQTQIAEPITIKEQEQIQQISAQPVNTETVIEHKVIQDAESQGAQLDTQTKKQTQQKQQKQPKRKDEEEYTKIQILEQLKIDTTDLDSEQIDTEIRRLKRSGKIYEPKDGTFKIPKAVF